MLIATEHTTLPVMESFYTLQGEGFHQGRAAYFIRLGGCDVGCFWCDVKDSWDADKHPKKTIEEIVEEAVRETRGKEQEARYKVQEGRNKEQGARNKKQESRNNLSTTNNQHSTFNIQHSTFNNQIPTFKSQLQTTNHQPQTKRNLAVITGGEPLMHDLDELTHALHEAGFETNIETSGSSPLSGDWDWICLSPKKFKAPLPEILPVANELKVIIFNKSDFKWAEQYAAEVSPSCKLYLQPEWDKSSEMIPLIIDYIKANPQWELSLQIHKFINVP